ncbi:MAG TPA: XdhC family protein [Gemmatimonadaceae bacterium]|nr:XdhC family protein [Gemmatimonadaceae bacterium]
MSLPEILAECARLAAGAGAGALASVAKRKGSLPMSATAKMLVTAGGARLGTVGGGCLEAEIIERAMDVLERRVPALSSHTLNAELAGDYGLTCGGTAEMLIEPVYPDAVLAAVYAEAAAVVARGERALMATGLTWAETPRKALRRCEAPDETSAAIGRADDALVRAMSAFDDRQDAPSLEGGVLVETIAGKPRLVVFGAGHVGAKIAQAAAFAGWRVTVVDDRADFADAARLPFAERAVVCDFHDVAAAVPLDEHAYAVIATRGHQHDVVLAGQLAPRPLRYLGMLGSRRKVALSAKVLRDWGVSEVDVSRIHAPVGLAIGADTPEEIAVSVVAEMISVRRAGSRRRGSTGAAGAGAASSAAAATGEP